MKWLTSNLLPLSILAGISVFLFLASFIRVQFVKPNWLFLAVGLLLLITVGVGIVKVIHNPPEQVETVDEDEQDGPLPAI